MDNIFVECTHPSVPCTGRIEPEYSRAYINERSSAVNMSEGTQRGNISTYPQTGRWHTEEAAIPSTDTEQQRSISHAVVGFAKRIETSVDTAAGWSRFVGPDMSHLRATFGNLLQEVLGAFGYDTHELLEKATVGDSCQNKDLLFSYQLACLLAAPFQARKIEVSRIEIGCVYKDTEFICFMAERSVGIMVHRNDNLFALCTSGGWHDIFTPNALDYPTLRDILKVYGGQVHPEEPGNTGIKVLFSIGS